MLLLSITISTLSWHTACAPAPQASSPAATDPGALINALVSLFGVVSDPNGPFASNGALGVNGVLGPGCLANNTAALGLDGPFGVNGPFGPNGQFRPNGPRGPFGPNGQVSESYSSRLILAPLSIPSLNIIRGINLAYFTVLPRLVLQDIPLDERATSIHCRQNNGLLVGRLISFFP